jgi:basic membrane protein A
VAERADALRRICSQNTYELLIAHGGQGDLPVQAVEADFAAMHFAITQGHHTSPQTACYEVLQEQSAFLAGILAGLASVSRVVAHMSGEKVRPGLKGRAAFAHGLRLSGPDCRFVSTFCGNQHDPDLAYRVTQSLQSAGADLVFAMIDGGRAGVNQACRELPIRQIGNVLDWVAREPGVFVASAVADSGRCIGIAIDDYLAGTLQPGTRREYGFNDTGAVRLVVRPDLQEKYSSELSHWVRQLATGSVVPDAAYEGPEWDWQAARLAT